MSVPEKYNDFIKATCWYAHANSNGAGELAYLALGIAGEAGEAADVIKKTVRDSGFASPAKFDKAFTANRQRDFMLELGDVLWYVTRCCQVMEITLEDLMVMNTDKLYERMVTKGMINPAEMSNPFYNDDGSRVDE